MHPLSCLAGCPQGLQHLDCGNTSVDSLAGCPPGLRYLNCSDTLVESLAGCPPGLQYLDCSKTGVDSVEPWLFVGNWRSFIAAIQMCPTWPH